MDAREFDFTSDNPLPQTCQHCKWAVKTGDLQRLLLCSYGIDRLATVAISLTSFVKPNHTCKHWEERE